MLAWRALTNNRLQQLEEDMLTMRAQGWVKVKPLHVDPKAVFAEEE